MGDEGGAEDSGAWRDGAVMTTKAVKTRYLGPNDWPEVMDIEEQSFRHPWTPFAFRKMDRRRSVVSLVAECDCEVVGYIVFEVMVRHTVLHNLAVHPKYRRNGVATELMRKAKGAFSGHANRFVADVSEYSDAAHFFLKREGFVCTEVLRDCYEGTDEAGYHFEWVRGTDGA